MAFFETSPIFPLETKIESGMAFALMLDKEERPRSGLLSWPQI